MLKQKNNQTYSASLAATTMLVILGMIVSVYLVVDSTYSFDQKETIKFNQAVKICEEAQAKAVEDFNNGIFRMYFPGGMEERGTGFPFNFYDRLERDYGIDIVYTGDVSSGSNYKCYNLKMDNLLDKKLGEHTIEDLFSELRDEEYPR